MPFREMGREQIWMLPPTLDELKDQEFLQVWEDAKLDFRTPIARQTWVEQLFHVIRFLNAQCVALKYDMLANQATVLLP